MITPYSANSIQSLKKNMLIAEKVLRDFKSEYPYLRSSSRTMTKMLQYQNNYPEFFNKIEDSLNKLHEKCTSTVTDMRSVLFSRNYKNLDDYIATAKNLLKNTRGAECDERADIIYYELKKANIDAKLVGLNPYKKYKGQWYKTEDPGHRFVLIGTKKGASLKKPETWGNKAVIIDPWLNLPANAHDMLEYYNKLFMTKDSKLIYCEVSPMYELLKRSDLLPYRIKNYLLSLFTKKNT